MPIDISLKGIRQGILVTVGDAESWSEACQALLDHLDKQGNFLQGARIALNLGNYVLKAVDMGQLRDALSERELYLWAVVSNSPTTEKTAQTLGLETRLERPKKELYGASKDLALQGVEEAVMIYKTVRSGFKLQHPGHVVVVGDVNPGAEIIAGGNIIIWGKLQGLVHAGAQGDESAIVCALDLRPMQLRIAEQVAITPQRKWKPQPEMAKLVDGKVIAEAWNPKKKKAEG